jgi:hypothetical protein
LQQLQLQQQQQQQEQATRDRQLQQQRQPAGAATLAAAAASRAPQSGLNMAAECAAAGCSLGVLGVSGCEYIDDDSQYTCQELRAAAGFPVLQPATSAVRPPSANAAAAANGSSNANGLNASIRTGMRSSQTGFPAGAGSSSTSSAGPAGAPGSAAAAAHAACSNPSVNRLPLQSDTHGVSLQVGTCLAHGSVQSASCIPVMFAVLSAAHVQVKVCHFVALTLPLLFVLPSCLLCPSFSPPAAGPVRHTRIGPAVQQSTAAAGANLRLRAAAAAGSGRVEHRRSTCS